MSGVSRAAALLVGCPKCSAAPRFACEGKKGTRASVHRERLSAASGSAPLVREGSYWTPEWRQLRYSVLRANKGVCSCCGARPTTGKPLHVDHIKPRSRFPKLALDPSNLQVLCADCNLGKGATDTIDWRSEREKVS